MTFAKLQSILYLFQHEAILLAHHGGAATLINTRWIRLSVCLSVQLIDFVHLLFLIDLELLQNDALPTTVEPIAAQSLMGCHLLKIYENKHGMPPHH